ncbi:hypothetical protein V4U86_17880 [Mycobacterium sp. AMU20-3851]|uniref:hypothetical protein n=1 Tax=Mycobacterium sp. AMU20-3851 TaxID=3122055 RepID=UPI0037547AAE
MTTGAGAAVALTLLIGPAPIAASDPGSRGSHSGQSNSRDDARGRGGETPRGRAPSNDSRGDGGRRSEWVEARDGSLPPWTLTEPTQDALRSADSGVTARTSEPTSARTSESTTARTSDSTTARTTSGQADRPSVPSADGARTVRTARSARGADATTGGSGRRPVAELVPPGAGRFGAGNVVEDETADPVTVTPRPRPQPATSAPAGAPAVVAPEPSAPAAVLPPSRRISAPWIAELALPAPPLAPDRRPGQPMTSLFGVLGLLLIPMAGAALGYRQARAARSVGVLPQV